MNLYEYLIGGKKQNKPGPPFLNELQKGDKIYFWAFSDDPNMSGTQEEKNEIWVSPLHNIEVKGETIITYTYNENYPNGDDMRIETKGFGKTSGKPVDMNGLKLFCATTLEELKKIVPKDYFNRAGIKYLK